MKVKVIYIIMIFVVACNNNNTAKRQRKIINNKIIEAYFLNDSIVDGPAKYYDTKNRLESVITFSKGLKNGPAINYYQNGKIHDSSFYENGHKNGVHYVFDSIGKLIYLDKYFHGLQLGSQIFYRNNKPFQYVFSNFEKQSIYSCSYDSIRMLAYNGEIININIYTTSIDNQKGYGVMTYFLDPPKIEIKYFLGVVDSKNNQKKLTLFDNKRIFIDTILKAPPVGWKYFISAEYNDRSNNLSKVYLNTLEF